MKVSKLFVLATLAVSMNAFAINYSDNSPAINNEGQFEELRPGDANIDQVLSELDETYFRETGESLEMEDLKAEPCSEKNGVSNCKVVFEVNKSTQRAKLFVRNAAGQLVLFTESTPNGKFGGGQYSDGAGTAWVSTGQPAKGGDYVATPNFNQNFTARIMRHGYTGGGHVYAAGGPLGTMPYAMFIHRGFAVHGTPTSNYVKLGKKDSHGCVRMFTPYALVLNRLISTHGPSNAWIRVTGN